MEGRTADPARALAQEILLHIMNIDALRSRSFRIYLFGNAFAANALWMQRTTIGWIAWELTGSAGFVGLIALLFFAPSMVTGPLFGVVVDRVNVTVAAFATQSLLMVLTVLALALEEMGRLGPGALILLAGVSGIVKSMHNPVRMSLPPRLVPRQALASVVTFQALNFSLARISGPAIAGWAIAEHGISFALLLQALLFLPFLAAMPLLEVRSGMGADRVRDPFLKALAWGVRFVVTNRSVRHAVILTGLVGIGARGAIETLPVLADGVFNRGPRGLGILLAAAGAGAIVAAVVTVIRPPQKRGRLPAAPLLVSWLGVSLIPVLGLAASWELVIGVVAAMGFCATTTGVAVQTSIQGHLEDDARGRVMSLWVMVGIGSAAAGAVLLGMAADLFGIQSVLVWGGSCMAVILGAFVIRTL